MRILVTLHPTWSVLNTMVPFAWELQRRGHDVRIATAASMGEAIQERGLRSAPAGLDWEASKAEAVFPGILRARARSQVRIAPALAGQGMVDDLVQLADAWRPDVIVRDSLEFGGLILGELLDVPVTVVGIALRPPMAWFAGGVAGPLDALRRQYLLPSREPFEGLAGRLWLSSYPAAFSQAEDYLPQERFVRPVVPGPPLDEATPDWLADIGDNAVYVTLGTVYNEDKELLRLLVTSLAEAGFEVIATTGKNVEPSALAPLPPGVRVAKYVTQSRLVPLVRAVVSHGGFNTVMGALSAGIPVCCIPLAADHPPTAQRCVDLGVGTAVTTQTGGLGPPIANSGQVTSEQVVNAVVTLVEDESHRRQAALVAAEIEQMPGPDDAAEWIEQLANGA